MVVGTIIDSLTDCIIRRESGIEYATVFSKKKTKITKAESKKLKKQGWKFDWSVPQNEGYDVYELFTEHDGVLQGMIAIKHDFVGLYTDLNLIEAAPHNIGHMGEYEGVGGNLFAIACYESMQQGFDGFVKFVSKTKLVEHYMRKVNAKSLGGQNMYIDEKAAGMLVSKYIEKGVGYMDNKLKEIMFDYSTFDPDKFGDEFPDGRLTEPSDPNSPHYDIRAIDREMNRLGRQLTEEELEKFIIED